MISSSVVLLSGLLWRSWDESLPNKVVIISGRLHLTASQVADKGRD